MASPDDINSTLKGIVANLSQLQQTIVALFPRVNGTFTLSAATTTIVTQPGVNASAIPFFVPTNATAALIVRTNGLFVSVVTAGSGFVLSTQSGSATSGGTFSYFVVNPS